MVSDSTVGELMFAGITTAAMAAVLVAPMGAAAPAVAAAGPAPATATVAAVQAKAKPRLTRCPAFRETRNGYAGCAMAMYGPQNTGLVAFAYCVRARAGWLHIARASSNTKSVRANQCKVVSATKRGKNGIAKTNGPRRNAVGWTYTMTVKRKGA